MKSPLLTIEEAAARRGISRAWLYSAIARKKLPRRYRRGRLVVREADLAAWDSNKEAGGWRAGTGLSARHKLAISRGQKRRWNARKP